MKSKKLQNIQWLTFDVLGTCVDWKTTLRREAIHIGIQFGINPKGEWKDFPWAWVSAYVQGIGSVAASGIWRKANTLIQEGLPSALAAVDIDNIPSAMSNELNEIWNRLDAWPDAVPGLTELRKIARIATLSNFGESMLAAISHQAGLPWDRILSSEMTKRYKTDPAVYQMAVQKLGVEPAEVMMVAAHSADLLAAQEAGFATAFVHRPSEDQAPGGQFDLVAQDFPALAKKLAAARQN